jgi:hypothetical protein
MIIDIKQKFTLLGRSFHISINGVPSYRARKRFFSLFSTTRLYRNDELKITMIKELGHEVENYDINLSDGFELQFKNPSKRESIYTCQVRNEYYIVYADRGSWIQVHKNDRLIAGWMQNDNRFVDHDYQIRGDEDFDPEIVIAFCLICDDIQSFRRNASTMTS